MAASPKLPMVSGSAQGQYHMYHADAYILNVELEHPIKLAPQEYGHVVLDQTRRESLITQSVGETNIEGLITLERGHTRVAGTQVKQKTDIYGRDHAGWFTLATAAIKGYNVEDIITVDRAVAQVSTQHPMTEGNVPRVNFIGTSIENLRVSGYPVEVELDLAVCGPKPEKDRHYLQDRDFLDRVHRQLDATVESDDFPESMEGEFGKRIAYIDDLKDRAKDELDGCPKLGFTLVKTIKLPVRIPGVKTFGNHIFIENFGTVTLGEVEVGINNEHSDFRHRKDDPPAPQPSGSNYFTLEMLNMSLGCPGSGKAKGPTAKSNGNNGGPGKTK